jgi:predicted DNA-binding ribbon-helix-helix protein
VPSAVRKQAVEINGKASSISLEDEFYAALCKLAHARGLNIQDFVGQIAARKTQTNLSSELRLTVLRELQRQIR